MVATVCNACGVDRARAGGVVALELIASLLATLASTLHVMTARELPPIASIATGNHRLAYIHRANEALSNDAQ